MGHDWGSMVVGQMALLHPERMDGVVVMSVPLLPRGAMPPVQMMRQLFGDSFFYILYFQEPGVADARPRGRSRRDDDPHARGPHPPVGRRRRTSPASPTPTAGGFVDRLPKVHGAAGVAEPGRARPLHRGVHPHRVHRRHQLVPQLRPELGDHAAARRRARHHPVGLHHRHRRPREPHEPGRRDGRPRPRPPRQHPRRRARATGSSKRLPTRSTPPCSPSSAPSTSEVPDARRCPQVRPDLRERRRARPDPRVRPGARAGQGLRDLRVRPALRQARGRHARPRQADGRHADHGIGAGARPEPGRVHGPRVLGRGARGRARTPSHPRRARS